MYEQRLSSISCILKPAVIQLVACACVLFLFSETVKAQLKVKIEHLSTESGLSHDGVSTIIKDQDGFMWFGTWDGIDRFDGNNFVSYKTRPGDSTNLKSNRIDHIVEDNDGYFWLGAYDNQKYRFDKSTGTFLAISDLLDKKGIRNVQFEQDLLVSDSGVWLTTRNNGVFFAKSQDAGSPQLIRYAAGLGKPLGLPSNKISFLFTDQKKNIWIGTDKGIAVLAISKSGLSEGNYHRLSQNLPVPGNLSYSCIAENSRQICLGTADGSVWCYDKSRKTVWSKRLSQTRINKMLLSANGKTIYITGNKQLFAIDNETLKVSTIASPQFGQLLSLYEDKSGQIWIEPELIGILKFDPARGAIQYFSQKKDTNFHNTSREFKVFEDLKGRVWVSMKGGGFGYYNPSTERVDYFYNQPGTYDRLFSNSISCSYFDTSGILWLSTRERGIEKILFQDDHFSHHVLLENSTNKSDNEVRGIYVDSHKRLWLASKSGHLLLSDKGKCLSDIFVNPPADGIGLVYAIYEDTKGTVWLGTKGNGLFAAIPSKEPNKFRLLHYRHDQNDVNSISSDVIYSILEDRMGRLWVGTFEHGLNLVIRSGKAVRFRNNGNAFSNYPKDAWDKIRHLCEDAAGRIWIATTHGLVIFNPGKPLGKDYKFSLYGKIPGDKSSLGTNDVQYVYRDTKSRMWVATSGGGLNKAVYLSDKVLKFKVFTKEDGLPSDYILSIIEDNKGKLWLGTENGISVFNPGLQTFRNYDSYDGLPKTGFSEASVVKLPEGNLMFGCINGYLVFSPDQMADQKTNVKMVFTNLQINNKDVLPAASGSFLRRDINSTPELSLRYNENIIGIDFTVLDYRLGKKQAYAYRLKGFSDEWNNVKNQHKAIYTNLPPGEYLFEVKSLNGNLYKSLPKKELKITIAPPLWQTSWAYLMYMILTAVVIEVIRRTATTMIRLRNRLVVEQKLTELKLKFFTNISHELRTPLTLIVNPIEQISKLENLSDQGREYIDVVRRNAGRMVRFVNQLLDFRKVQSGMMKIRPEKSEMIAFTKGICSYFSVTANEQNIDLQVIAASEELYAWIDPGKIDIVLYNLLSNAFKYAPANSVIDIEIGFSQESDKFYLRVTDQGPGIPSGQLLDIFELYYEVEKKWSSGIEGTGIGLALSKEIVNAHYGTIEAKNNDGRGATFIVELPIGNHPPADHASYYPPDSADLLQSATEEGSAGLPLVLIVEDNHELRKFLADQLKGHYRISEAKDGEEGLNLTVSLIPDLVLSDITMPRMGGLQLLDRLKNNEQTSHIPVILLTARTSVDNQIEGMRYGADYYITKPFHTDFILASIANLLNQRQKLFDALVANRKVFEMNPSQIVITSKDEAFLKNIIRIVETGMVKPEFNIDEVAQAVAMGRTTFYKKFKSLTGKAPVEFVREMRVKRGRQMLEAGQHNISEIAYAVGFTSGRYFGSCFKEAYGLTPSEFLKSQSSKAMQ